ncbi:unnamed protein product [Brassicogethes aeneus]|uniref:Uncharacterized protein n=1 Tax=Brassicogethes aeneus TaxID=1431903 RepID=A0A9P0FMY4_BRAAE|nr:unnamed protein product [Brassicogethes aeneus]
MNNILMHKFTKNHSSCEDVCFNDLAYYEKPSFSMLSSNKKYSSSALGEIPPLQLDTKTSESAFLEEQLELYKSQNLRLEQHVEVLQEELSDHISRLELIRMENETMKTDIEDVTCELNVEKETSWWKSTKQLANLSVTALETAAHIMLPAYLD